jgi:hypothetical protein
MRNYTWFEHTCLKTICIPCKLGYYATYCENDQDLDDKQTDFTSKTTLEARLSVFLWVVG